jgi:formate-nitrite transporter family protein
MSNDNHNDFSNSKTETEQSTEQSTTTERAIERKTEDEKYVPVIVKRTDEAVRHPDDTLEKTIKEGLEQLNRPFFSLSLSSIAAGMILGFTAMVVGIIATGMATVEQPILVRLAIAAGYPLGFIICIMSGTQLFTEHTATAVYPVLDRKASISSLLRLWVIILVCNIIGAAISAGLLTQADNVIQAKEGYEIIAHHLVSFSAADLIISSILAGWLMALGAWLIMATQPTMSQLICIYVVTFIIGLGGLHHSIAGSVEMFTAYFISDHFTFSQTMRFIGLCVFGNLIGGSVFVAVLNYSHIRKTQEVENTDPANT